MLNVVRCHVISAATGHLHVLCASALCGNHVYFSVHSLVDDHGDALSHGVVYRIRYLYDSLSDVRRLLCLPVVDVIARHEYQYGGSSGRANLEGQRQRFGEVALLVRAVAPAAHAVVHGKRPQCVIIRRIIRLRCHFKHLFVGQHLVGDAGLAEIFVQPVLILHRCLTVEIPLYQSVYVVPYFFHVVLYFFHYLLSLLFISSISLRLAFDKACLTAVSLMSSMAAISWLLILSFCFILMIIIWLGGSFPTCLVSHASFSASSMSLCGFPFIVASTFSISGTVFR